MEYFMPPLALFEAVGKKILDFSKKTLSFLWNVVYNNKETWSKVRTSKS